PAKPPNARSTYAYGPPVSDTRLPASAKQRTTKVMATAQVMYATGAAAPKRPVNSAEPGARKMPPPTVMLTMLAASPQTPSARIRPRSAPSSGDAVLAGLGMAQHH